MLKGDSTALELIPIFFCMCHNTKKNQPPLLTLLISLPKNTFGRSGQRYLHPRLYLLCQTPLPQLVGMLCITSQLGEGAAPRVATRRAPSLPRSLRQPDAAPASSLGALQAVAEPRRSSASRSSIWHGAAAAGR